MEQEQKDVSEGELAAMRVLWEHGPASIRQLSDALFPGGAAAQYATVQKQLERLEAKGFVRRDRTLYVHVFSAAVSRDELIGRRVRAVVDKLCDGSLVPLLTHLAQANDLSERERQALRELIDGRRRSRNATDKNPRRQG